jgi:hypothetical protein
MGKRAPAPHARGVSATWPVRPALLILVFLLSLLSPAGTSFAAQSEPFEQTEQEQQLATDYFTIYYPQGEEKTAQWYASFADEVDVAVSDLLGAQPVEGLTLRIYATEPDYMRANPMAELHPGILAHAIPEQKEIGVAVERLRQQPPELARESFRHEMTHIVAGILSDQNLPIGFHEGLAQYNELSESRGKEVRDILAEAKSQNIDLLPWADLNDVRRFRRNIQVAYPQSYAVMAFLADRYGMEPFARFIQGLNNGREYELSIFVAYGKRIDDLEREWNDYMSHFLEEGWQRNVLSAHDLSHGLALLQAGRFADAETHFDQAKALYDGLGRTERAEQAAQGLDSARRAREAEEATGAARKSLEMHDYAPARDGAQSSADAFTALNLPDYAKRASDISLLAQTGIDGINKLESARASMRSFNLPAGREEAREAAEAFSQLGDVKRLEEANGVLQELYGLQQTAGYGVLGVGGAALLGGALLYARRRSRRARQREEQMLARVREGTPSWL